MDVNDTLLPELRLGTDEVLHEGRNVLHINCVDSHGSDGDTVHVVPEAELAGAPRWLEVW